MQMSYKFLLCKQLYFGGFLGGSKVKKKSFVNRGDSGDMGSISGFGRSPKGGNGNSFQYSCRENSMDKGGWRAIVYVVAKSWTGLATKRTRTHTHTHTHTHTEVVLLIG